MLTLNTHLAVTSSTKTYPFPEDFNPASFNLLGETPEILCSKLIQNFSAVMAKHEFPNDLDKYRARVKELNDTLIKF